MYHITQHTRDRAKQIGVEVKISTNPRKKIDVFKQGELIASIGATGYSDYGTYLKEEGKAYADKRRELYHKRHTQNTMNEMLSKVLLW
jgi:hypothetical protein